MIFEVNVSNKIAHMVDPNAVGVCGNSDYIIEFNFDEEWNVFSTKTARFKYNGMWQDVVFNGNECSMPIIDNTYRVEIGVFAGNLHTTTSAILPMKKSILSDGGLPDNPTPSVYAQITNSIGAK